MLSKRLTELRKEKGVTQKDMSLLLGITRPAYTAYEMGKRQPDYETLIKLADYFVVPIVACPYHFKHKKITPISRGGILD